MSGRMFLAVCAVAALAATGCEDGSKGSSEGIVGNWSLSVKSQDGAVTFDNTAMTISSNSDGSLSVFWMSSVANGSATFDANTHAVLLHIQSSPTVLDLDGTLTSPGVMSGSGTIEGYGGIRIANWRAEQ